MEQAPLSSVLPREVPLELPSVKFGKDVTLASHLSVLEKVSQETLASVLPREIPNESPWVKLDSLY